MVKHKLTDLLSPDDVYEKFFAYGRLVIIHKATWCDMAEAEECILKSVENPGSGTCLALFYSTKQGNTEDVRRKR